MTTFIMPFTNRWIFDRAIFLIWMISGLIIAFSFYHQYIQKVEPCTLCQWQRLFYSFIFCISPFGLLQRFNQMSRIALTLLFFAGFSLALYHTFIQLGWLADRCDIQQNVETINDFMQMLSQPKVSCSTINWQLFGLSASIYNAFFSVIGLICLNFTKLIKLRRKGNAH